MHEVQINRLGGLSLPRKSVVRLTDRPDMTLGVYRGRKTTIQQQQPISKNTSLSDDSSSSWNADSIYVQCFFLNFHADDTLKLYEQCRYR